MSPLLKAAVLNNASWCDTICKLNNVPGDFTQSYWLNTQEEIPNLYPNVVMLEPISHDDNKIDQLYSEFKSFGAMKCLVKDSFTELDLNDLNFTKIIDAQWIGFEPKRIEGALTRWQRIHFPKRFDKWLETWEKHNKTKTIPFPAQILKAEDIWICGEYSEEAFSKGAILFIKDNTIGISNIFSAEAIDHSFWEELMGFIGVQFPGFSVVGYQSGRSLKSAIEAGFTPVGRLAIWEK